MADHTPSTTARTSAADLVSLIEKGATVHDAIGLSMGNVTDVDLDRQLLVIDGRPVGHDLFEVPLSAVAEVKHNEVHLGVALDARAATAGAAPSFMAPPVSVEPRPAPLDVPTLTADPQEPDPHAAFGSPIGTTVGAASAFGSPTSFTAPPRPPLAAGPTPTWAHTPDDTWDDGGMLWPTAMGLTGLAATGLAIAGYAWWRRRRRKSTLERAIEFAANVHPAWWAGLAAAAVPIAYSMLPSETSSTDQVRAWLDSAGRSSQALADDQLTALRRFKRQTADPQVADLGQRAERWAEDGSARWERLVEAASALGASDLMAAIADRLPSTTSLPTRDDLPSFSDLPSIDDLLSDARGSRLAMYGLPAAAIVLAGAIIYALTRKSGHVSTTTRVSDVMTRRPQVIRPDASVAEAAALMRNLNVGAVPICDGSRLVGMLTDRDIALRLAADGRDPQLTRVQDIMSEGATWASEGALVEEAARIMREHRIRRLPIVDERHNLVGIVSLGDLATEVSDDRLSGDTLEEISQKP